MEKNLIQRAVHFVTQTTPGRVLALGVAVVLAIAFVGLRGRRPAVREFVVPTNSQPFGDYGGGVSPLPTPAPKPPATSKPTPAKTPDPLTPISIYDSTGVEPTPPPPPLLPSGRMISCKLVNTVDSSSLDTPVIALVTEDLWFRQRLIVPKGTEVLGRAQSEKMRDRIAAQGTWRLVFDTGEELSVSGIALDQDRLPDGWGPTDGTAGLLGHVRRADHLQELKLFLSTFLAGLAEPFKERESTAFGLQVAPTAKNAAVSGIGNIVESYAERVLRSIEAQSVFVRVPAGKAFWLFTSEPLSRNRTFPISVNTNISLHTSTP